MFHIATATTTVTEPRTDMQAAKATSPSTLNATPTKIATKTMASTATPTPAVPATATKIHLQLKALVQTERKITQQILDLINQCEVTRCYAKLGYSSMFEYLHKGLGYSEGSAQRRLSSARLLREMPEIRLDLQLGNLNLTQVSMAQIAIRQEEKTQSQKMSLTRKKEIIEKLKTKNTFESKTILTSELSSFSDQGRESIRPVKDNQVQITITLSQEQFEQLQEAQDYLSNSVNSSELKDYLLYVTKRVLQKKRALHKIKGLQTKKVPQKQNPTAATAVNSIPHQKLRPYIDHPLKTHLLQNANFQCQYVSKETRKRCAATRFLHIDHIQPVAFNGSSAKENLRIYCQAHNHLAAIDSGLVNPRHIPRSRPGDDR